MTICKISPNLLVNIKEITKIYTSDNHKVVMELKTRGISDDQYYLNSRHFQWKCKTAKEAEEFIEHLYNTIKQCK